MGFEDSSRLSCQEPQKTVKIADKHFDFLIDRRDAYSVLTSHAGLLSSNSCIIMGVDGKPHYQEFTLPLLCQIENIPISHQFLMMSEAQILCLEGICYPP